MSDAMTDIYVAGEVVAHGRYQGSADLAHPGLARERDWNAIDSAVRPFAYRCEHEGVECVIYSHYGGGFHWPGRACLECMALTDGHDPWLYGHGGSLLYGAFTREEEAALKAWRDDGWPRDGRPSDEAS